MTEHGTIGAYRAGCRCARCRAANTENVRAFRDRQPTRARREHAWDPIDGMLPAECWCGRRIVLVDVDDIRNGITGTCGRIQCRREESHGR